MDLLFMSKIALPSDWNKLIEGWKFTYKCHLRSSWLNAKLRISSQNGLKRVNFLFTLALKLKFIASAIPSLCCVFSIATALTSLAIEWHMIKFDISLLTISRKKCLFFFKFMRVLSSFLLFFKIFNEFFCTLTRYSSTFFSQSCSSP